MAHAMFTNVSVLPCSGGSGGSGGRCVNVCARACVCVCVCVLVVVVTAMGVSLGAWAGTLAGLIPLQHSRQTELFRASCVYHFCVAQNTLNLHATKPTVQFVARGGQVAFVWFATRTLRSIRVRRTCRGPTRGSTW